MIKNIDSLVLSTSKDSLLIVFAGATHIGEYYFYKSSRPLSYASLPLNESLSGVGNKEYRTCMSVGASDEEKAIDKERYSPYHLIDSAIKSVFSALAITMRARGYQNSDKSPSFRKGQMYLL